MAKSVLITDFLTDEEISKAKEIYNSDRDNFHKRCLEEIIKPNMERINDSLGQENDPSFLAYAVEYVMSMTNK